MMAVALKLRSSQSDVKIIDSPMISVNSSFLARQADAVAMAADLNGAIDFQV
jgi:hypothetical protein